VAADVVVGAVDGSLQLGEEVLRRVAGDSLVTLVADVLVLRVVDGLVGG
jgi:hypothetical protein